MQVWSLCLFLLVFSTFFCASLETTEDVKVPKKSHFAEKCVGENLTSSPFCLNWCWATANSSLLFPRSPSQELTACVSCHNCPVWDGRECIFEWIEVQHREFLNQEKFLLPSVQQPDASSSLTSNSTSHEEEEKQADSETKTDPGPHNWGRILDAGTGEHSLRWINSLPNTGWSAVTASTHMASKVESLFFPKKKKKALMKRAQDQILIGSWIDDKFLSLPDPLKYDVVIADYLLGAIDGFTPYFQDQLFSRLYRHVGKRLYVTGTEPLHLQLSDSKESNLLAEAIRLQDACYLLTYDRPYREFPLEWVIRNLEESGFRVESFQSFPIVIGPKALQSQLADCRRNLYYLSSSDEWRGGDGKEEGKEDTEGKEGKEGKEHKEEGDKNEGNNENENQARSASERLESANVMLARALELKVADLLQRIKNNPEITSGICFGMDYVISAIPKANR